MYLGALLIVIVKAWAVQHKNAGSTLKGSHSCKNLKFRCVFRPIFPTPDSNYEINTFFQQGMYLMKIKGSLLSLS